MNKTREINFKFTGAQFYILALLVILDVMVWTAAVMLWGSALLGK